MGITMRPDRFPEHRRQDAKRAAEARVFDALQNLSTSTATACTSSATAAREGRLTTLSGALHNGSFLIPIHCAECVLIQGVKCMFVRE